MSKFLYGLVLFFSLCLGLGILGSLLPPTTGAYEDPALTSINACYHKHERFVQPTTEADKGDLFWWCTRRHHGINR